MKVVRQRSSSSSPGPSNENTTTESSPHLTLNAANISEADLDKIIKDARGASQSIEIRDPNGMMNSNFSEIEANSELEFNSDIVSSTEIDIESENQIQTSMDGTNLRRSKRLTATNPIIRLNSPHIDDFHRKRHRQAQPIGNNQRGRGTDGVNRATATTENRVR